MPLKTIKVSTKPIKEPKKSVTKKTIKISTKPIKPPKSPEPKSKKTSAKKPSKPPGIKIVEWVRGGNKEMDIIYHVAKINIRLYYNFFDKDELYLNDFYNENPKKKGQARTILYNIVNWLLYNKKININDKFSLHSKSPKDMNQLKLNEMYEKLGFKKVKGTSKNKPKYSMSIKDYLTHNK